MTLGFSPVLYCCLLLLLLNLMNSSMCFPYFLFMQFVQVCCNFIIFKPSIPGTFQSPWSEAVAVVVDLDLVFVDEISGVVTSNLLADLGVPFTFTLAGR